MIIQTIWAHINEYRRKNYSDPRFIIMTHQQRRELIISDSYRYMEYNPNTTELFMGTLVHVAPPDLDMSDWLFYGASIDIRSEDGT